MNDGRLFHIFCDESRQTKDRYMVLGGLMLDIRNNYWLNNEFAEFRKVNNMYEELKWTKVSDKMVNKYMGFVEIYFQAYQTIRLRTMVVDTRETDNRKFNNNDNDLGFYKLMYQFLLHSFFPNVNENDRCIIYLDQRTTNHYKLSDLKKCLNFGLRKKFKKDYYPIVSIEAVDSKDSNIIQLIDVLIGAIGYASNDLQVKIGASKAKIALMEYIAKQANVHSFKEKTTNKNHLKIWHFHYGAN